jgi:adenosylcobyric acid synthase
VVRVRGALMVCGTSSDAGKSVLVAGLARSLSRRGVSVAPFKAQNMSLNSAVTVDGAEIGRAQALQAAAAGVEPEAAMNPILLKPTGERSSQVIVLGRAQGTIEAAAYRDEIPRLWDVVLDSLAGLRARFDVVLLEGAGGAAEINLFDRDLVNLPLVHRAGVPALLVGDIERGGVFASVFGSIALLPAELRATIRGFVINKMRGDPALLGTGPAQITSRTGVPCLGVVPWLDGVAIDAEGSLALERHVRGDGAFDVAVVRLPCISNFTDFDPLAAEPDVSVRYVHRPGQLGRPNLILVPGTKATVSDLAWLRDSGVATAVERCDAPVLGICGGEQLMGERIVDDLESGAGEVSGLGWLAVDTEFAHEKVVRRASGSALGASVHGYEIRHGRTTASRPWLRLEGAEAGSSSADGRFRGTALHGLFESDAFRAAFLADLGGPASRVSFEALRQGMLDRLADHLDAHLDMAALDNLVVAGA